MQTVAMAADDLLRFLAADMRTSPPHLELVWRTLCCDVDMRTGLNIRSVDPEGTAKGFDAMLKVRPL